MKQLNITVVEYIVIALAGSSVYHYHVLIKYAKWDQTRDRNRKTTGSKHWQPRVDI